MNESTQLMSKRIRRILLVCSNFDSFSLEEDGRLEARITLEYSELNLSNPPVFVRAENTEDALRLVKEEPFDLVITMYNVGGDVFDFAAAIKEINPDIHIVMLSAFSREIYRRMELKRASSCIDYTFCWNGSTDLIIAIIKLLEDKLNAPVDILEGGVQCILLVEDSVRYYSTYLALL